MFERFEVTGGGITRTLKIGDYTTVQELSGQLPEGEPVDVWDGSILRGAVPKTVAGGGRGKIRIVDLFCGAGGLSLGVIQAFKALGYSPVVELAGDLDGAALEIYDRNIGPAEVLKGDVSQLVSAPIFRDDEETRFTHAPWVRDRRLAARLHGVDVLVGGPPCQGHSNLNNKTRRYDPRNELYLVMPTVAVALDIPIVIIENVREVRADRYKVVDQTIALLSAAGYTVKEGVVSGIKLGIPQTRFRYFIVAVKEAKFTGKDALKDLIAPLHRPERDLQWAIGDLATRDLGGIHSAASLSPENLRRIDFLFNNNEYNLPDEERPTCHQGGHTYDAVYGRLKWNEPAGTITTGFLTPGRGRFIHPDQRRTLTPLEAARVQGFPDSFLFSRVDAPLPTNKVLTKVIGDAVPPPMGFAAAFAALRLRVGAGDSDVDAAA